MLARQQRRSVATYRNELLADFLRASRDRLVELSCFGGHSSRRVFPSRDLHRDIAPIFLKHCVTCHQPGQSAPFSLFSYAEAKKRAKQIAEVTANRYMPPWLPEHGYGEFANDRSLTSGQIERIQQWDVQGVVEGRSEDLPPLPKWSEEWQLGRPDLVIQLPEVYELQSDGKDVYRNFVVPIPTEAKRYVKGVEFKPGNYKVVHHAFINIDNTRHSRRLAEKEAPQGFDGMELPETAHMPGDNF